MRNYLTLVLSLIVLSTPAFASRARLESLGESKNGSFFIDDSRNMFFNPAFINNYKKKMFLEFGAKTGTATSNAADATNNTKPEGGFTNTFGDFSYGVYMGHESDRTLNAIQTINGIGETFSTPNNALDFFFGGDAGVKWGVTVEYAGNESKTSGVTKNFSQLITRLGVIAGQAQGFATVGIISKAVGGASATDELDGKLALDIGGTFNFTDNDTVFAKYTMNGSNLKPGAVQAVEINNMSIEAGVAMKKDVTKNTNVFSRVQFGYASQAIKTTVATGPLAVGDTTSKLWNVPLSLGVETAALSWLTIRGSVSESLLGQNMATTGDRASWLNSTAVAAGVGMTFGDVVIDGLVASGNGGANTTNIGSSGSTVTSAGSAGTANAGFGDQMLARVGLTYNF